MPPRRPKNADLPPFVSKTPAGLYKYQRRVPKTLQDAIGKRMWDYSLTSNPANAYRMAEVFRATHDRQIATLKNPEARAREVSVASAAVRAFTLTGTEEPWRQTPEELKEARTLPADAERERLATFSAIAFGSPEQTISGPDTVLSVEQREVPVPSDPTDVIMFNAFKAALDARLAQIAPVKSDDPLCITALIAIYSKAQAARLTTANGYRRKVERFVRFAGDHGLSHYDDSILRAYRDYLINGNPDAKPKPCAPVKPATVHQYFAPLKAMWKWAADEYPEHKDLAFPRVRLPKDGDTVEETRWQAFDDQQIKIVWRLLSEAWGPDGNTRLSQSRRKAFLYAFRVMLFTGMRPSEVFRIKAEDLKDGVLFIRYTKTKTARRIPLADHLSDLPEFLGAGGFAAELEAGRGQVYGGKVRETPTTPESLAKTLRGAFTEVIHAGGLCHPKLVLYSLKDTLIDRLQRQGASDDVMRGIIGHVSGQGKLRHYKTPFGQTPHGMEQMRRALDQISYW